MTSISEGRPGRQEVVARTTTTKLKAEELMSETRSRDETIAMATAELMSLGLGAANWAAVTRQEQIVLI